MSDDQQQNKPPESQPATPFGSRFGSSARPGSPTANQQQSAPTPPSRPSGLLSRVGSRLDWRILPVTEVIVHFTLDGLGDPFHRILGKRLMVDFGKRDAIVKVFEAGGADVDEIVSRLEIAWQEYVFSGALMLYPWNVNLPQVMAGRLPPGQDDDEDTRYSEDNRQPPTLLRSVDPLLVLNVLGRARANILLPETPLVLEKSYLNLSLMADDPRLIALVQATGYVEESLVK